MRYDKWDANDRRLLTTLQNNPLFQTCLQSDIRKGVVFPAIRKQKIDFYHVGRKLFSFDGRGFRSNIAYLVAFQDKPNGEVTEADFQRLQLCTSFFDGYAQIKKNTLLYKEPESLQVSRIWNKHSCCRADAGRIVVLDIELSLDARDEDRTADRIDLVLLNCDSGQIKFFEAKTFSNKDIRPVRGHIPVVDQVARYAAQVKERRASLLAGYSQYVELLNELCDVQIPIPESIDEDVDLLVFEYDTDEGREMKGRIIPDFGGQFHCSTVGNARNVTHDMLQRWWKRS